MSSRLQIAVLTLFVSLLFASRVSAQSEINVQAPTGGLGWLTHPYRAVQVPAIRLTNSPRFNDLIRAGNLYLTAQDVVALAIENNIDVEVQRYGPLLAQEVLRRAKAAEHCEASGWAWRRVRKASACRVSASTIGVGRAFAAATASVPAAASSRSWVPRFPRSIPTLSRS